jgi:hypothetical protein
VTIVLPCFLAAADGHAGVHRLDDARRPDRLKLFPQRVGDLRRQPLLHLRPPGEALDQPGELAEADDLAVGQVRHVRPTGERQQVVLAERVELDVAQQHDLVVAFGEDGLEVTRGSVRRPAISSP